MRFPRFVVVPAVAILAAAPARAQGSDQAQALAKQLSNPIASLVSIPFQFNWENGVGPNDDLRYVINIQPVAPFQISEKWNLIARWIMPYISQPFPVGAPASGWGDIVASGFFSPTKSAGLTWGIGPVLGLPTTTDPVLGSGKWSAGPTVVALKQKGSLTYGLLANQLWSFANTGNIDRPEVSQALFQPFFAYGAKGAVTYTIQSEATANWLAADESDTWTVPINLLVSKVTKLGPFPFSAAAGVGSYVQSPTGGPEWKLRTAFTLILPKGK
jgi:hypothetical protein